MKTNTRCIVCSGNRGLPPSACVDNVDNSRPWEYTFRPRPFRGSLVVTLVWRDLKPVRKSARPVVRRCRDGVQGSRNTRAMALALAHAE